MTLTKFTTTWKSNLHHPCALLLSGHTYDSARKSFFCQNPLEEIVVYGNQVIHRKGASKLQIDVSNPWDGLKKLMMLTPGYDAPEWVGYLAYEMGAFADLERPLPYHEGNTPDAHFVRYGSIIEYDHLADEISSTHHPEQGRTLAYDKRISSDRPLKCIREKEPLDVYQRKIEEAKALIRLGEIYQVNLSQQMIYSGRYCPATLFALLYQNNPAPFSAFLDYGAHTLVSSSPERFLSCIQGKLETRPIKGTMPRGCSAGEDKERRKRLISSEKERAELLMITDLMRNDLSKISIPGSVKTDKMWHCESYTNVFHLLSIITAKMQDHMHPIDAVRACFPAGSITGCPKMRSMEAISSLEKRRRGIYTGAIGYFCGSGDFDFNVAIRTLDCHQDQIDLQVGGAITIDSDPFSEYEETLHKGASLFQAIMS